MSIALYVMMGVYVVGALLIIFRRPILNWLVYKTGLWRGDS